MPDIDIKSYEQKVAETSGNGEYYLHFYNKYRNLCTKYLRVQLSSDGKINIVTNHNSLSIYRNIDNSCKLDFKINERKRDALIHAKLSEMYNTEQMSYKSFEIKKELYDSKIKGHVFMYNDEICICYNLDVYFTVFDSNGELCEEANTCNLLIPLRLIEK